MKIRNTKDVNLGTDSVGELLFKLAVPAITSQVVNALYNMVDRIYIGHIKDVGTLALTGVGVCFPIIMLISAFASLLAMGAAPLSSIEMGRNNKDNAEEILGNSFIALIIMSIILTVVIRLNVLPLIKLFGASEKTIPYALDYMNIYVLGSIFVQLTLGLNAFISAQGFARVSMITVIIGAVSNIILDPILIFGLNMGVKGAAIATVISQALSMVWAIKFLLGKKTILKIKKKYFKLKKEILIPSISLGFAPFIMQSTESVLVLCFNSSLLRYGGDLAVGAMTILSSVMQFTMLPIQGLTQGAQPIISYNYGAKNIDRIKKIVKLTIISAMVFSSFMWILAQFVPQLLVRPFTSDPSLIKLSSHALRIYMASLFMMGAQLACQQSFIAFGYAKTATFLAILRKLILLIPLIYILPLFMENKVSAVFLAEPIADAIAIITTLLMFIYSFKKLIKKMEIEKLQ
ncbi:MAG: MATE family efflux transporter [Peptostreptococcus sp.]|uniref:MATE family efflux transporter n=1 Tax=Peptostreptococcus sp. TaxID=1262 RepID=UPI002FC98F3A